MERVIVLFPGYLPSPYWSPYWICTQHSAIHETNALKEVLWQQVGKFLLKSTIALCRTVVKRIVTMTTLWLSSKKLSRLSRLGQPKICHCDNPNLVWYDLKKTPSQVKPLTTFKLSMVTTSWQFDDNSMKSLRFVWNSKDAELDYQIWGDELPLPSLRTCCNSYKNTRNDWGSSSSIKSIRYPVRHRSFVVWQWKFIHLFHFYNPKLTHTLHKEQDSLFDKEDRQNPYTGLTFNKIPL